MKDCNEILKDVGIKCSLGCGHNGTSYYCIAYTPKQASNWCNKLNRYGFKYALWSRDNNSYLVRFH